ncbi:MAG: DUF2892 domain-containing protein [Beijerinckiaceae bacterium]|nr:DUF2892 domain-containing protein [Beijerinckiaceae bacterium]
MNQNIGKIDRVARIIGGLGLLSMPMFMESNWKWLGLLGLVLLITALAGWCPAYGALGVSTGQKMSRAKPEIFPPGTRRQ